MFKGWDIVVDDTRYAYAVGRIRALEARLLNKSQFESLIAARNAEEALSTLSDTDYGPFLSELKKARDFEMVLNEGLKSGLYVISGLSREEKLTNIFRLRYDFHNLKALLKIKYLSSQSQDTNQLPLINVGLIEVVKLRKMVEGDDYGGLPRELRIAAEKAIKAFENTHAARWIDIILDREMFALFSQRTRDSSYPFLKKYFQIYLDLINIKNFLRTKELKIGKSFFKEIFLEEGGLKESLFLKLYEEPINNLASALSFTFYGTLVSTGIKYWQENRSWSELERLADNCLLSYLRQAKYIVFGLEPLIVYLLVRENEIKMLRIIIAGKLNGLPADLLRSRLRDTY